MKKSIVCLTRGYQDYRLYNKLVFRNRHIEHYLQDKETDILIFHEGNIDHQEQIKKETPTLKITFVDVKKDGFAFNTEREKVDIDRNTSMFNMGYRHMCSFWFVDFWKFVEEYDLILRIDEDCYINFKPDKVFESLQQSSIISGLYEKDDAFVTKGMNDYTRKFISETNKVNIDTVDIKLPGGPYTNIVGFNLAYLRGIPLLHEYIESIKGSNKIYQQRWGDLPLWGEAIHYIVGKSSLSIDKTIQYFHGSHSMHVNK
jgi:hypothetical protein